MASFLQGYDIAMRSLVFDRFKSVFSWNDLADADADRVNLSVCICPKGIALREFSEKRTRDYLSVPAANVWRMGTAFSWARQRSVVARRGFNIQSGSDIINVTANPMDLTYGVWFWSQKLELIYQAIERYTAWQHDNPKIEVTYNDIYTLDPEFHFAEVVDESDIEQIYSTGKYFVWRMPLVVDAWLLKAGDGSDIIINKVRLTVYDKDDVTDYDSIVVEDSGQDVELEAALRLDRLSIYGITAVDLTENTVSVPNDRETDFSVGDRIRIVGSTSNDEMYTVSSDGAAYDEGSDVTAIYLVETLVDDTADGYIEERE
jgi:hypothetical protein